MTKKSISHEEAWTRTAPYVEKAASQLNPSQVKDMYADRGMTLEEIAIELLSPEFTLQVRMSAVHAVLRDTLDRAERHRLELQKKAEGGRRAYALGIGTFSKEQLIENSGKAGRAAMQNMRDSGELSTFQSYAASQPRPEARENACLQNLLYCEIDPAVVACLYISTPGNPPMLVEEIARFFGCRSQAITQAVKKAEWLNIITPEDKKAETRYRNHYRAVQANVKRWSSV